MSDHTLIIILIVWLVFVDISLTIKGLQIKELEKKVRSLSYEIQYLRRRG